MSLASDLKNKKEKSEEPWSGIRLTLWYTDGFVFRRILAVPIVDGINWDNMGYYSVYDSRHHRGIFEWGFLYKESVVPDKELATREHASEPYKWVFCMSVMALLEQVAPSFGFFTVLNLRPGSSPNWKQEHFLYWQFTGDRNTFFTDSLLETGTLSLLTVYWRQQNFFNDSLLETGTLSLLIVYWRQEHFLYWQFTGDRSAFFTCSLLETGMLSLGAVYWRQEHFLYLQFPGDRNAFFT